MDHELTFIIGQRQRGTLSEQCRTIDLWAYLIIGQRVGGREAFEAHAVPLKLDNLSTDYPILVQMMLRYTGILRV